MTQPTTGYGSHYQGGGSGNSNPQPKKKPVQQAPATPKPPPTAAQDTAEADLKTILATYGLSSLANWAWQQIVAGESEDQVVFNLSQTAQFKARFPAIALRQAAGLPAISPGDYVTYENQAAQQFQAAGFPASYIDNPANYTQLIANDVGQQELGDRINLAVQAAYNSPPDTQTILQRDYGISPGMNAAAWFDPKVAEPLLAQHFLAAQIGTAADQTGYGSSKVTDDYLAQLGVSQTQAAAGFNDLATKSQLFTPLPGEAGTGIDQNTQIAAEFGQNAAAQQAVSQVEQDRLGAFKEGGTYQSGSGGFSGIGTSRTQ
jgi:hypothetical protein